MYLVKVVKKFQVNLDKFEGKCYNSSVGDNYNNQERSILSMNDLDISSGVSYLKNGYIDYAQEVIAERAIPNVYDGLKPVVRRLLWTFYETKSNRFVKSQKIAGETLSYHPHNADSVYKASVNMVDKCGFSQVPLLSGSGNFGNVSTGEGAASMRYTEEKLAPISDEFFKDINGVKMIPNYDSTLKEPEILPVSFPFVLCHATEGIAVGFGCKIPSFNFNDVMDLAIEYLEEGECKSVIVPDFMTRGYYVRNNKELLKLMKVGKASLKLRGRVIVQGKDIIINEVPFGKDVLTLKRQIEGLDSQSIVEVSNLCDRKHGICLMVRCRSKAKVDEVLYQLYKDTDLQYNYHANITVVQDGMPKELGVYRVIEEWVKWRRGVYKASLESKVEPMKQKMRECKAFMALVSKVEEKNEFVQIVSKQGKKAGQAYLEEHYTEEEIPRDLLDWVSNRGLSTYHTGGRYATEYENALRELKDLEDAIENIDNALISQWKSLKAIYGGDKTPRMTEVTSTDYEFAKVEEEEVKIDNSVVYYTLKDNFLKKMSYPDSDGGYEYQFQGIASDTLIAIDSLGHILRIYAKDIPLHAVSDTGIYLPRYLELGDVDDDYKIMWMSVLDGNKYTLLYKDGNVGFLDTSEFIGSNRQVRVLTNGVHKDAWNIGAVLSELPEALLVLESTGKLGWVQTASIKQKSRTARTRVFRLKDGEYISAYAGLTLLDLSTTIVSNAEMYQAPYVRHLVEQGDYQGENIEFHSCM